MSNNGRNNWRTQPMYSFSEVARLAGVSTSTVRNWLLGYTVKERQVPPLFKTSQGQNTSCSFLNLIEIVVAARFRKADNTSFQIVRRAYENAKKEWGVEYPFAHYQLRGLGGHIVRFISGEKSLQAIDQPKQWTIPYLVIETIDQLEYELELAARWYPSGKKIPIVVDPRISAGVPVIEGRGVTVENIEKRFYVGKQKWEFIARDLELQESVVQEVIRYAPKVFHREEVTLDSTLR